MTKTLPNILLLCAGILVSLALAETTFRVYAPRLGTYDDFLRFKTAAHDQGMSLRAYGTHLDEKDFAKTMEWRDRLGWNRPTAWYDSSIPADEAYSVLILGDSVTQGDGLSPDATYPYLLSRRLAGVRILNAGLSGYGIDQMLFKGLQLAAEHELNLVLFAYIPHDLVRVGKRFMYGSGKPKFAFNGDEAFLLPAPEAGPFHTTYDNALRTSSLLFWYLRYDIWPNREYYAPWLYRDYYRKVFAHIQERMATLAANRSLDVVFVKLTNSFDFRGEQILIPLATEVFSTSSSSGVHYYDVDLCVGNKLDIEDPEYESIFYFHPTAEGHRLFADCLSELIASRIP